MFNKFTFENQNKKLFARWSFFYDSGTNRRLFFEATYRRLIATVKRESGKLLLKDGCRVLDVACGTGEVINRLATEYKSAVFVGVDLTDEMLAQARNKSASSTTTFLRGEVTKLPLESNSFDIVICSDAFHHFGEPERGLEEIHRVLKPHGMFFIVDPSPDTLIGRLIFNRFFKKIEHAHHYYSELELRKILHKHKLTSISKFSYYFHNYFVCKKD